MRRYAWRKLGRAGGVVWSLSLAGCLYDSDDRCSPGEIVNADGYCVCQAGHAPKPRDVMVLVSETENARGRDGCVACAQHEVVMDDACVCEPGYTPNATGECVKAMVAKVNYGAACTSDGDCTGPGASCVDDDVLGDATRAPYCSTRDCKDVSECPASELYGCYDGESGSFCRKPPSGEGDACSMADGSETNPACSMEATACAFDRCTAPIVCRGDADCTPGLICCDLSSIPAAMGAKICTVEDSCFTR